MGAMGIPVTVPAQLTELDALTIGRQTVLILTIHQYCITFLTCFNGRWNERY